MAAAEEKWGRMRRLISSEVSQRIRNETFTQGEKRKVVVRKSKGLRQLIFSEAGRVTLLFR